MMNITEAATSEGIWGWVKNNALSMILPGFLVTGASGLISERFGDSIPDWARPFTDILAGIYNFFVNKVRGIFAKDELAADEGLRARFDAHPALRQAAAEVGGTPAEIKKLTEDLQSIMHRRIREDTGFSMSVDVEYAVTAAQKLQESLTNELVRAYKERNKQWTPQQITAITPRYEAMATAIAGANGDTKAADVNPNTPQPGYVGSLIQAQRAEAAEGTLQASQISAPNLPDDVAALARDAASSTIVPAPPSTSTTLPPGRKPNAPAAGK